MDEYSSGEDVPNQQVHENFNEVNKILDLQGAQNEYQP